MRRSHGWSVLALVVALAGCFESGRSRAHEDAGVVAIPRDAGPGAGGRWHVDPPASRAADGATVAIAREAEPASLDPLSLAFQGLGDARCRVGLDLRLDGRTRP